jgi:Fe-S oxidoreductase
VGDVLKQLAEVTQVAEERVNSLCCGGSLGDLAMNAPRRDVIRDAALNVLCESRPDVLVTACPLCKKTFDSGHSVVVKDIAEIVAENIILNTTKVEIPELVMVETDYF